MLPPREVARRRSGPLLTVLQKPVKHAWGLSEEFADRAACDFLGAHAHQRAAGVVACDNLAATADEKDGFWQEIRQNMKLFGYHANGQFQLFRNASVAMASAGKKTFLSPNEPDGKPLEGDRWLMQRACHKGTGATRKQQ